MIYIQKQTSPILQLCPRTAFFPGNIRVPISSKKKRHLFSVTVLGTGTLSPTPAEKLICRGCTPLLSSSLYSHPRACTPLQAIVTSNQTIFFQIWQFKSLFKGRKKPQKKQKTRPQREAGDLSYFSCSLSSETKHNRPPCLISLFFPSPPILLRTSACYQLPYSPIPTSP